MKLEPRRRRHSGEVDHISALPDDLLLLILAGLGCTAAAARTSGLSRRWRGLWARLGDISLCHVPFQSLTAVLSLVARPPPPAISHLEIRVPRQNWRVPKEHWPARVDVASLLRAAARLTPERLLLAFPPGPSNPNPSDFHLPCFRRAAYIGLGSFPFVLRASAAGGEFAALHTLHLIECIVDNLDALLLLCPSLRALVLKPKATTWLGDHRCRTVHSATLEKLAVDSQRAWASRVDVVAPALKKLAVSFWACQEMSISVSAPMAETFLWRCRYATGTIGFGLWSIDMLTLETTDKRAQLPSLQIYAYNSYYVFSDQEANLAQEIEKHMLTEFSDLELHLSVTGHVFGALVLHILAMNRIRNVIRRFTLFRQTFQETEACPANCPCEPTDWRTQIISLTALEEVEIDGFQGDDHEYDLLELIFSCAPMLKKMTVKLPREVSSSNDGCTKLYDIFASHSSVECHVYLAQG